MASPASVGKHPIHPMLIPFPIGLWIFSLICDVIYLAGWGSSLWSDLAFYSMVGGLIGALIAAAPGLIDYLSISDPPLKTVATAHMVLNLVAVVLYAVNIGWRVAVSPVTTGPFVLSLVGIVVLGVSGWLGGTMVYVHGMAVEPMYQMPPSDREMEHVGR